VRHSEAGIVTTRTTPAAIGFPPDGIHAIDASIYDEASNRYYCTRCRRMIDANAWAKECKGLQPVNFTDLFKIHEPGVRPGDTRDGQGYPAHGTAPDRAPSHSYEANP
jgi:hypothetical protein